MKTIESIQNRSHISSRLGFLYCGGTFGSMTGPDGYRLSANPERITRLISEGPHVVLLEDLKPAEYDEYLKYLAGLGDPEGVMDFGELHRDDLIPYLEGLQDLDDRCTMIEFVADQFLRNNSSYYYHAVHEVLAQTPVFIGYDDLSENLDRQKVKHILSVLEDALRRGHEIFFMPTGTDASKDLLKTVDGWLLRNKNWLTKRVDKSGRRKSAAVIGFGAEDPLLTLKADGWNNLTNAVCRVLSCLNSKNAYFGAEYCFHERVSDPCHLVNGPYVDEETKASIRRAYLKGVPAQHVSPDPNYQSNRTGFYHSEDHIYRALWDAQHRKERDLIEKLNEKIGTYPPHFSPKGYYPDTPSICYSVNRIRDDHNDLFESIEPGRTNSVLLTLYHSGTAYAAENKEISVPELARKLRAQGIVTFAASENGVPVDFGDGSYITSKRLKEAGIIPLFDMLLGVAGEKLRVLSLKHSGVDLIQRMLTNIAGEITPNAIRYLDDYLLPQGFYQSN